MYVCYDLFTSFKGLLKDYVFSEYVMPVSISTSAAAPRIFCGWLNRL